MEYGYPLKQFLHLFKQFLRVELQFLRPDNRREIPKSFHFFVEEGLSKKNEHVALHR